MQPVLDEVLKAKIDKAYKKKLHYEPDLITIDINELTRVVHENGVYALEEGRKIGRTEGHLDCLFGALALFIGFVIYNYFL